jgi:Tfp pilus assembly protein PilF
MRRSTFLLLLLSCCASTEPAEHVDVALASPPSATAAATERTTAGTSPTTVPTAVVVPAPDPATAERMLAEKLFDEGRKAMSAGDYKTACPKFEESHRIEPAVGSLINLAACLELSGQPAAACQNYREALVMLRQSGQTEREKYVVQAMQKVGCP